MTDHTRVGLQIVMVIVIAFIVGIGPVLLIELQRMGWM